MAYLLSSYFQKAVDSWRKKKELILQQKHYELRKIQAVLFFLLHASTLQFVTTRHPDGSVPVSLSAPEPTRTTDLAVSFYD